MGGGESDLYVCGPTATFSIHLASSAVTPAGSVHKSRGDGCDLVSTWFKYHLRKVIICSELGTVAKSEAGSLVPFYSELLMCGGCGAQLKR